MLKPAPVKYTCPEIDSAQESLKDAINTIDGIIKHDFEELRTANQKLRDWGSDMYIYAEELETEVATLKDEIEVLNNKIDELQRTIQGNSTVS